MNRFHIFGGHDFVQFLKNNPYVQLIHYAFLFSVYL